MKTLAASTLESDFDLQTQGVLERPIDAVELTDEDLEKVAGSWFPGFGFGGFMPFGFGGFFPSFGFGGFMPFGFGGFGFGPSIALNQFAFAGGGWW